MKSNLDSIAVFIFSFSIILISSISIVFPALLIRLTSGFPFSKIDPLEPGLYAVPLLAINSIFLVLYFMYYKKRLPSIFYRITNYMLDFDVSPRKGIFILFVIVAVYVGFSVHEIFKVEDLADIPTVLDQLSSWSFKDDLKTTIPQLHTKMFFLKSSEVLFQNLRVLPFFASISLLVLTYFFSIQITSKRLCGLIAVATILQSHIFLRYDTIITYANFWVLFYLFSLYLVKKSWPFSVLSYITSFFAKPLTLAFFPQSIFYIVRSPQSTKKRIPILISYLGIFSVIVILFFVLLPESYLNPSKFIMHQPRFFTGFTILPYQLRYDYFVMLFLIPLYILLFKKSLSGQKYAQSLQILISGIILAGPLLTGLFNYQLNPYRLVPLIVFFAIGFGLLFSRKLSWNEKLP